MKPDTNLEKNRSWSISFKPRPGVCWSDVENLLKKVSTKNKSPILQENMHPEGDRQKLARIIGKRAEKKAKKWLEKHNYDVRYWHEGRASNLPYDIICYKGKDGYAFDVKTGKQAEISLISFKQLLNKPIKQIRKETKRINLKPSDGNYLKPINYIGYIFVLEDKFIKFSFKINAYRAFKAWDRISNKKQ